MALSFQISSADASKLYVAEDSVPIVLDSYGDIWAFKNQSTFSDLKKITFGKNISQIASFSFRTKENQVYMWGVEKQNHIYDHQADDLMDSTLVLDYKKPVKIKNLKNILDISSGGGIYLAVNSQGDIYQWQYSGIDEKQNIENINPIILSSGTDIRRILTNGHVFIGEKKDKSLIAWGKLNMIGLSEENKVYNFNEALQIHDEVNFKSITLGIRELFIQYKEKISYYGACYISKSDSYHSYKNYKFSSSFLPTNKGEIIMDNFTPSYKESSLSLFDGDLVYFLVPIEFYPRECKEENFISNVTEQKISFLKGFKIKSIIKFSSMQSLIHNIFIDESGNLYATSNQPSGIFNLNLKIK